MENPRSSPSLPIDDENVLRWQERQGKEIAAVVLRERERERMILLSRIQDETNIQYSYGPPPSPPGLRGSYVAPPLLLL